ncbi:MAG: DUF1961 family protein [Planctomycetota bacterium]
MRWTCAMLVVLLFSTVTRGDEFHVTLRLDEPLQAGELETARHTLAERPGVGRAVLRYDRRHLVVEWQWAEGVAGPPSLVMLPVLPADEPVTFAWSWDAEEGSIHMRVGGVLVHGGDTDAWKAVTADGADVVGDLPDGWSATLEPSPAGSQLRGILGVEQPPVPDLTHRLGEVLYANSLDQTPGDWVIEGPLKLNAADGELLIESTKPDAQRPDHGHGTIWLPPTLPGTYVVDWTFTLRSETGLAIIFFDARPRLVGITDLMDPRLPQRDGTFNDYTAGPLDSMHVSYFAQPPHEPGRGMLNLRENSGLILRAIAPAFPIGDAPVRMRLIRDRDAMWLLADERVVMSASLGDPTGGRFGLRQMQWTRARYDDLTITELRP